MYENDMRYVRLNPPTPSSVSDLFSKKSADALSSGNMPQNHFLGWLQDRMSIDDISINFSYNEDKYLKEVLNIEHIKKTWNPMRPVFISAQTGAGKTTFIFDELLREVSINHTDDNNKILLLSNRIALGRQNKYDVAKWLSRNLGENSYLKGFESYTSDGIDKKYHNYGMLDIYTYHQLDNRVNLNEYKYIICDECHFFTSDSRFNTETNEILKK